MTIELITEVVPPKKSGRKPKTVDAEMVDALSAALKKAKVVDGRPSSFGPSTDFDSEGKATSEARRYVAALTEGDDAPMKGETLSVRAVASATDGKFQWRIYKRLPKKSD